MRTSSVIAIGHACTESGSAVIVIYLENERVALSPSGARKVALQLMTWADHAEAWKQMEKDERSQIWAQSLCDPVPADRWVAVESGNSTNSEVENEHGSDQ